MLKSFYLNRLEDVSGVSNVGRVAFGYIYDNGVCAMKWLTAGGSVGIYASISQIENIHGHQGKTEVIIEDKWTEPHLVPSWVFDPVGCALDDVDARNRGL